MSSRSYLLSRQPKELKKFTVAEVAKHNTDRDLWLIIHNKVYDFSGYARCHPGGAQIFYDCAGKDASKEWDESEHPFWANGQLKAKLIGEIVPDEVPQEPLNTVPHPQTQPNTETKQDNDVGLSSATGIDGDMK